LSKSFSWLKVFFSSFIGLANRSSFDNSEGFDNVVELPECFSGSDLAQRIEKFGPEMQEAHPLSSRCQGTPKGPKQASQGTTHLTTRGLREKKAIYFPEGEARSLPTGF
jgi:hypothetical protein